jgi:DNA-binding beta-propeller fold protein YncE
VRCMKANLLLILSCLVLVFFSIGFAARGAGAGGQSSQDKAATQSNAPTQSNASEATNIEVDNWAKPEPGWLYVLDPKPEADEPGGRIWLVNPETAEVMGSIRTGDGADFALSPDGSTLYVASVTDGNSSELAVIDTADGVIPARNTIEGRAMTDALPPFSTMAVSGDGLTLRILTVAPSSSDADFFRLAAFDTRSGSFLPESVRLWNCGPGRFINYRSAEQFDFFCPRTNKVRLISVDANSHELRNLDIKLPWVRRIGAAEAIEDPDTQEIAIVRGDGAVIKMNTATQEFAETLAHPELPDRVPPAAWPSSPDGSRIYLGYNRDYDRSYDNRFYLDYGRPPNLRPNNAMANEFRVLDAHTWQKIGTIKTAKPFWSAVTANDGKTLYAMAPQQHSILVIDTVKMRQTGVLKVGGTPALALVAP